MGESALLRFYRHAGADPRGRSLRDIRAFGVDRLEGTHDFIQWLFPLPEASGANPQAPRLVPEDIEAFGREEALRDELRGSLDVMLRFYGLERRATGEATVVARGTEYAARSADWLDRPHNFLRLSRILRSLALLGCAPEASALLACLEDVCRENEAAIGSDTLRYWRRAAGTG